MAMSTVGVLGGFWLSTLVLGRRFMPSLGDPRWIMAIAVSSLVISIVIAIIYFWREKTALTEAALEREQRRAAEIERVALAANLRALQAQIEPHFLFNTLANVTSLIEPEPARARHMLEAFIRFLRASLAATRRSTTTLADEFALIADFLEVLKVRMGERLQVSVDLPPGLGAVEIPPMLVQPVVENAIRHGLEPKVEGGRLDLRARREGERLVLEVADTGVGFGEATTGGLGLANIRERLRLAHGDGGRLSIRANPPGGTIVAIELPVAWP
ncbi:MAG: sensor histidine kinase [Burkholderiales bacterium]|nr:sensor histidine kinase [Burkholderiales bacterium]